jgi:hypothetical protein
MPQLDIFTFIPVITWLVIIIIIFYNILLFTGLSRIYKILLYRKKKLIAYNKLKETLEREIYFLIKINNKFFLNFSKLYKFSPHFINIYIEKELDNKKEFLVKEIIFYKNFLHIEYIAIQFYTKQLVNKLINKNK